MSDTINDGNELKDTLNSAIADIDGAPIVLDRDFDAHPELEPDIDGDDMSEYADELPDDDVRFGNDDEPYDGTDAEADSEWLASAGMGTDEDYGGGNGFYDE